MCGLAITPDGPFEAVQDLDNVGPAGAKITSERGAVGDHTAVQKRLIKAGLRERIAVNRLLRSRYRKGRFERIPGNPDGTSYRAEGVSDNDFAGLQSKAQRKEQERRERLGAIPSFSGDNG